MVENQKLIKNFFYKSETLAMAALLPLDHIYDNWELRWNESTEEYREEDDSFSPQINGIIRDLVRSGFSEMKMESPIELAQFLNRRLDWPVETGSNLALSTYLRKDAEIFLLTETGLYESASVVIEFCIRKGFLHFDDLDEYFREILGSIISALIYLRDD